ncbi:hypothetical protein [Marinifilum sp.]|uniref:hypothetical protein n=1 Tax=Marinifilum sp. TaxID=2033137 RepID=UPI003BABE75D
MNTKLSNKTIVVRFLFILIVATQSCTVSSLNPLYTDKDRVHLEELNGEWIDQDQTIYEIKTIVDSLGLNEPAVKTKDGEESYNFDFFTTEKRKKEKIKRIKRYAKNPDLRKHYKVTIISKKDTCVLDGRLSNLDDHYFIDVVPNEDDMYDKMGDTYAAGLMSRNHGFLKLHLKKNEINFNSLEQDAFDELVQTKKIRIEHVNRDNKIIITAKTEDIQKFLIKFADSEMFNNPKEALILKRTK